MLRLTDATTERVATRIVGFLGGDFLTELSTFGRTVFREAFWTIFGLFLGVLGTLLKLALIIAFVKEVVASAIESSRADFLMEAVVAGSGLIVSINGAMGACFNNALRVLRLSLFLEA
jgi:hypothetical protein